MSEEQSSELIQSNQWFRSDYEQLRQSILIFNGNIDTEVAIVFFNDVHIFPKNAEAPLKGVFYLTTKRLVFMPKNMITSPNVVQCPYEDLRGISGVRSTVTISVIDSEGGIMNFLFPGVQGLYQCFNLLRRLAEDTRNKNEIEMIQEYSNMKTFDETPFSTLDVELSECVRKDVDYNQNNKSLAKPGNKDVSKGKKDDDDSVINSLAPMKAFFDHINQLNFDLRTNLRFLFVTSLISFCLQYIPFIPFLSLCVALYILSNAWRLINKNKIKKQKNIKIPKATEGFVKTQMFISDWFQWRAPRKTIKFLIISISFFIGWIVLPKKFYLAFTIISYLIFLFNSLKKQQELSSIFSCFWLCI